MIFFEAGINDLLLPALRTKGYLYRQAEKYTRGCAQPCENAESFEHTYREAVQNIKAATEATIILTTLGCLNENLEHPLNKKRCAYNDIIRDVAIETGCGLVDAGALFDGYLRRCRTKDYLLESFWNTWCFDKFQCSVLGSPDYLSKKRGLHLTIDGVHLNSRGANIFRDETERQIKSVISGFAPGHQHTVNSLEIF
jgi:lysophospholipase L1-like esterase